MGFSVSNIFSMGYELLIFAALTPLYINTINQITPHVGTVTKLILQLVIPAVVGMILISGTESQEVVT